MSTQTVNKPTIKTTAHKRWLAFLDAHLPTLFIGAYVLGMGIFIAVLIATGRIHG